MKHSLKLLIISIGILILLGLCFLKFECEQSYGYGIVNNSGTSSEDSITFAVPCLDSLGRPTTCDSFYVVVIKSDANAVVFRDSGTIAMTGLDSSRILGRTVYYYHRAVSDIDGAGFIGQATIILGSVTATADLPTQVSYCFQITNAELSDGLDSAGAGARFSDDILDSIKVYDTGFQAVLTAVKDTTNAILDSLQLWDDDIGLLVAMRDSINAILDTLQLWDDDVGLLIAIRDTVNAVIDSLQNQDNWIAQQATLTAVQDTTNAILDTLQLWDANIAYLDEAISGIDDNPWDAVTRSLTDKADFTLSSNYLTKADSGSTGASYLRTKYNEDKTGYTASTVSDKTGYSLSATGLDADTSFTNLQTTVGGIKTQTDKFAFDDSNYVKSDPFAFKGSPTTATNLKLIYDGDSTTKARADFAQVTIKASGTNSHGLWVEANGEASGIRTDGKGTSGNGIDARGGTSGNGGYFEGGATIGRGIMAYGADCGIWAQGTNSNAEGAVFYGQAQAILITSDYQEGIEIQAATDGMKIDAFEKGINFVQNKRIYGFIDSAKYVADIRNNDTTFSSNMVSLPDSYTVDKSNLGEVNIVSSESVAYVALAGSITGQDWNQWDNAKSDTGSGMGDWFNDWFHDFDDDSSGGGSCAFGDTLYQLLVTVDSIIHSTGYDGDTTLLTFLRYIRNNQNDYKADVSGLLAKSDVEDSGLVQIYTKDSGDTVYVKNAGSGGSCDTIPIARYVWAYPNRVVDTARYVADGNISCEGTGSNTVIVWIKDDSDSGGIPLFRIAIEDSITGGNKRNYYTNASGVCTLGLDNGHYSFYLSASRWTITSPVYNYITKDTTFTYYATAMTPSVPPEDSVCVVYGYVFHSDTSAYHNARVRIWMDKTGVTYHGALIDVKTPQVVYTDTNGYFEFSSGIRPNDVLWWNGNNKTLWWIEVVGSNMSKIEERWFEVPVQASYDIGDIYED